MIKYQIIFIIVVYKNILDLKSLLSNIKKLHTDSKSIVVNNYFDDESMEACRKIALENNCDFLNVPNDGYGCGNNRGIAYANDNYDYDFLIVSNPDITIKKFNIDEILPLRDYIVGPIIKTKTGKDQNPYWVINNKFAEWLIYRGYLSKKRLIVYTGIAINKIIREVFMKRFLFSAKKHSKVFALHGSFVVFPKKVIDTIGKPYDEDMFLFAEEVHLAHLLDKHNIKSYITKSIEIIHKENGSIDLSNINETIERRKSIITYYEKLNGIKQGNNK